MFILAMYGCYDSFHFLDKGGDYQTDSASLFERFQCPVVVVKQVLT